MKPNRKNPILAAACIALATQVAQATTYYWDGNNNTANFGSLASATWGSPTVGTATTGWTTDATGASVVLANSITTTITDDVNFGTGVASRGLGGSALTVAAGGVNVRSITWGSQTTTSQTISGGPINIGTGSTISVGAGGTTVMTIASNLTGTSGFGKTGNTLALSGTNSGLTGTVNVTAGSLIFRNVAAKTGGTMAFGATSTLGLGVGGTGFFDATDVTNAFAGTMTGNLTNITLNAATNISLDTSAGNFIYGGSIASSPTRGLTKDGGNTLTLTGANTFTGTTLVRGGTLRLENAAALGGSTLVQMSTLGLQLGIDGSFSSASTTLQGSTGTITLDRLTSGSGAGQTHVFGGLILNGAALNFAAGSLVTVGTTPTIEFGTVQVPGGSGTNGGMNPTTANVTITGNFDSGPTATGTATYTLSGSSSGNLISGNISNGALRTGGASLAKTGTSIWTLSGTNGYTGTTTVSAGALITTNAAALPGYNAPAKVVFNGGTIGVRIGAGGWSTPEVDALLTAGNATKTAGALGIDTSIASQNQWTDFTTGVNSLGPALGLTKLGTNTLTLNSASNNYAGATTIDNGTLKLDVDHTLAGALTFGFGNGTTSNTGTLDLATTNVNATFGALNVLTNSATANTITIGTGKTLLVTGALTMGYNAGANSSSKLTATGLGTLSVGTIGTPTNANVQIGAGTSSNNGNSGTLDLSGLSKFDAYLGTGTLRIGSTTNGSGGTSGVSSLILASTSTIQATNITLGSQDNTGASAQSLLLGNGTNTLNATNITVSDSGRGPANLMFNGANGTLTVRGLAGDASSRANLALAVTAFPTSIPIVGTLDTTNHAADLRFGSITAGQRTAGTSGSGQAQGDLIFNQGTLDANDLIAGSILASAAAGSGNAVGNVNMSGGTATFNSIAGAMVLGVNVNNKQTGTGNLNISGTATVTVAANTGTSIRLGDATVAGGSATGNVNVTGGTLTVAGDIIRGATTGTSVATIKIAGGTLDMGGNDIGAAGAGALTLTAESGTLKNVASINGSGGLTKTTAGTLIVEGTNGYLGATDVNDGKLVVNGNISTSNATVSGTGSTLSGSGAIGGTVTIGNLGTLASGNGIESLAMGDLSYLTGSTFEYEVDKSVAPGVSGDLTAVTGNLSLGGTVTLSLVELGTSGAWELGNPLGDALTGSPNADKLTLISYSGSWNNGLFTYLGNAVLDDSAIVFNGQQWWFNYNDTDAGDNFTGDLTGASFVTITVPEPRAALLGGLGMLALLRRRRN